MRFALYAQRRPSARLLGLALGLCYTSVSTGQTFLAGGKAPRLFGTDMAIFEAGEARQDLPCKVEQVKPLLGFDLKFHAGYEVSVPMRELAGGGENLLTVVFRVRAVDDPASERYFIQRVKVPALEEDAKGDAELQGQFDIGEGKYKVDWLMRDRAERVCSSSWEVEAELPAKDKQMNMNLLSGSVAPSDFEFFREDPPVQRGAGDQLLNVKVMINFAPQRANAAALKPVDISALTSILRSISRDPRIGKFSLVVFNMQDQKVLYKKEGEGCFDFPSIGEAINEIKVGTVSAKSLAVKNSETEFLSNLLQSELGGSTEASEAFDGLVFVGPKVLLDANVPQETLRSVGSVGYPVFYLNYNLYPQQIPWRDSIGHAVKFFRGVEYTISRPRDLWFAVTEMVDRIGKAKQAKRIGQPAQ